jgi:hypothetical protein
MKAVGGSHLRTRGITLQNWAARKSPTVVNRRFNILILVDERNGDVRTAILLSCRQLQQIEHESSCWRSYSVECSTSSGATSIEHSIGAGLVAIVLGAFGTAWYLFFQALGKLMSNSTRSIRRQEYRLIQLKAEEKQIAQTTQRNEPTRPGTHVGWFSSVSPRDPLVSRKPYRCR